MKTQVNFRHVKSDPELQTAAIEATKKFEKFYDDIISTDVVFKEDAGKIVEVIVHVQGNTLVAKETTDDFYKSLNEGIDKMVRQLKKWKEKLMNI
jgi:ribosomal subunit interface protein